MGYVFLVLLVEHVFVFKTPVNHLFTCGYRPRGRFQEYISMVDSSCYRPRVNLKGRFQVYLWVSSQTYNIN